MSRLVYPTGELRGTDSGKQGLTSSMTEDFVIKYFWSAIGYGLMSIPIFYPAIGGAVIPGSGSEHDQVAARAEGQLWRAMVA
jgi:hypothetical protein